MSFSKKKKKKNNLSNVLKKGVKNKSEKKKSVQSKCVCVR